MRTIQEIINMNTFNRNIYLLHNATKTKTFDTGIETVLGYEYQGNQINLVFDNETNNFVRGVAKTTDGEIIRF